MLTKDRWDCGQMRLGMCTDADRQAVTVLRTDVPCGQVHSEVDRARSVLKLQEPALRTHADARLKLVEAQLSALQVQRCS